MIWAKKDGIRISAKPGITDATCPQCNNEVIAKCGSIKVWHFAHKSDLDCDSWNEGETDWHISWKNYFPGEQQEVILEKCDCTICEECKHNHDSYPCIFNKHRADIKNSQGIVIELQNSSISPLEINEREKFYKNMVWLINGSSLAKGLLLRRKDNYITFRWRSPPKSLWEIKKPFFIHLNGEMGYMKSGHYEYDKLITSSSSTQKWSGDLILQVKKIYEKTPCGGWGILITKKEFIEKFGGKYGLS